MLHRRIGSFDGRRFSEEMGSSGIRDTNEHRHMMTEIRSQNFEAIRFASYRLANKLRFVQKKTNLHLVDIWNVIEAFRENGLNSIDHHIQVGVTRLEALVCGIYCQLNKRLPTTQQVDVNSCSSRLLNWMLFLYDANETCCLKVFSIKVSLVILCAGKLTDKLRYLFSQISDANGHLILSKFSEFLKDALALPAAVYESPTFSYSESMAHNIFDTNSKITVNNFIDVIMSDSCPTLIWLPLLHRLASVEGVEHPVLCDGCGKNAFMGFRYKCQSCYNYQLCQECFWRGRTTRSHSLEHEMKEYATFKSTGKQLGHVLRKSFRCVPDRQNSEVPWFPETPERTLNLAHIVPPSPVPYHNGFQEKLYNTYDITSINSGSTSRSPTKPNFSMENTQIDEEHRLIARYAARLAADANHAARSPSELSMTLDTSRAQRELVAQLEAKNREILREIARLHHQQDMEDQALHSQQNPTLLAELKVLRQRKEELEQHLSTLQESRRELMVQLESLMKLLKSHQASPRSTPNSSPHSGSNRSLLGSFSRSAPTTPGCYTNSESLIGLGGDVRMAFGRSRSVKSLRSPLTELFGAAEYVTSAMTSLVREFNSGDSEEEYFDHLDDDVSDCPLPKLKHIPSSYRKNKSDDLQPVSPRENTFDDQYLDYLKCDQASGN